MIASLRGTITCLNIKMVRINSLTSTTARANHPIADHSITQQTNNVSTHEWREEDARQQWASFFQEHRQRTLNRDERPISITNNNQQMNSPWWDPITDKADGCRYTGLCAEPKRPSTRQEGRTVRHSLLYSQGATMLTFFALRSTMWIHLKMRFAVSFSTQLANIGRDRDLQLAPWQSSSPIGINQGALSNSQYVISQVGYAPPTKHSQDKTDSTWLSSLHITLWNVAPKLEKSLQRLNKSATWHH
jgi:hypothetical protein